MYMFVFVCVYIYRERYKSFSKFEDSRGVKKDLVEFFYIGLRD